MMKSKLRIGVIGCSAIAENSVIPAIIRSKFAELQFIGSRSIKKAERFSTKFSCKHTGNYDDVLDSNVDAVYISLPIGLHEKWSIKAARKNKHVLCEKSSTISFSSAKKMINEARKNKIKIMEALMFRFHPSHKKVRELIRTKIKTPFVFYSSYGFPPISRNNIRFKKNLGGGIFNDAGCYPICASRILFGKEPTSVLANFDIDKKTGVDTKAVIMLNFSNKKVANMYLGYDLEYQNFYSIWGKTGHIKLSRAYNIPAKMKPTILLTNKTKTKIIKMKAQDHFKLMIDAFSNYCNNNRSSIEYDVENDFLMQAKIMDAVRKSQKGKKVILIK